MQPPMPQGPQIKEGWRLIAAGGMVAGAGTQPGEHPFPEQPLRSSSIRSQFATFSLCRCLIVMPILGFLKAEPTFDPFWGALEFLLREHKGRADPLGFGCPESILLYPSGIGLP